MTTPAPSITGRLADSLCNPDLHSVIPKYAVRARRPQLKSFRRPLTAFLIALMAVSILGAAIAAPAQASGPPQKLAVQVAPSVIPADGGTYPSVYVYLLDASGSPTLAFANVTVYLTTSTPAVGVVLNSSITIEEGKGYAVADFQSTPVVGSTVITASASGFSAGQATVKTAVPRGYPTSISVVAVPSEVNSTSASLHSGTVVVEFEDQAGQPAKIAVDTQVSVYSSSPKIVTLNQTTFTMKAGRLFKTLSFSSGLVPGSATVVASAPQMSSGSAEITVLGRPPLALELFAQPDKLLAGGTGRLVIALTDLNGNPTRAPRDTVVQLRSSSTATVSVPTYITIPAGSIYATVVMAAGATANPTGATITASSSGLQSAFAQVPTVSGGGAPAGLVLYVGPSTVLADNGNYSSVVVSLVDSQGNPTLATSAQTYDVILTSSQNSSVGEFGPSSFSKMSITQGVNNVVWNVPFTSTFVPGTTSLTVSAQDLLPATGSITTIGSVPSRVAVSALSSTVPADGGSHPALEVSLEDSAGGPAVAPSPVTIYLSSSEPAVAQVDSPLVIKAGASAALVDVRTTSVGGSTNITAYTSSLNSGYASSSAIVVTSTPSPSAIGAYLAPSVVVPSPLQKGSTLVLQLQDSSGNPAKAPSPVSLTVTSSDVAVINGTMTVEVAQGASYAEVPLISEASGEAVLTVTSPGLKSASASFKSIASPFVTQLLSSALTIEMNQQTSVTFTETIDGHGVQGANITWSAVGGTVSSGASVTDASGQASVVFGPTQLGVATVTANVTSKYSGSESFSTSILVSQPTHSTGVLGMLMTFPYYLILAGAVAAVVVVVVLLLRRRRKKRSSAAEGDLLEDEQGFSYLRDRKGPYGGGGLIPLGQ